MSLRKTLLATLLFLGLGPATAAGPDELKALEFMKQSFSQVDIHRIGYISHQMALAPETSEKFWPLYQNYLHKQIALRDRQLATLTRFATHFNQDRLNDKRAQALLAESLAQERQRLSHRQHFIGQLNNVLNPAQQLRLYQLELLLDAQVRSNLLSQIPLADGSP